MPPDRQVDPPGPSTGPPGAAATGAVAELLELLDLAPAGSDRFRAASHAISLPFVFGGQVAAQAVAAAHRTVPPQRRVESLHAMFLAPGDPARALDLEVQRLRDGRSFSARHVTVTQGATPVFTAMLSFHAEEAGIEHAESPSTVPPDPHDLPTLDTWLAPHTERLPAWWVRPGAIDLRYPQQPPHVLTQPGDPVGRQQLWMRAAAPLPERDDLPGLHACVLTYASDLTLLDPVMLRHRLSWYAGQVRAASLDHAIWFHRPVRADSWLLYDQDSPTAHGGRALARGQIFDAAGLLCASVAQEGVVRITDAPAPGHGH
jgi:acyl-CoA thioesterase-2